ncbi:MAG: phospholipid carrier-dependent glycosyltransferase [Roseiarcus sp.]|jgi:dolichyl-phosphate-mannose--protein O-mannosyl transferase
MPTNLRNVAARLFAPTREALALWCAIVFLGSLALFLWGLGAARDVYFDETWYVPTARALIKTGEMLHPEHPPLGKLLIACGMLIFGDDTLGWRAMSALFGSLTLVATLIWSFALLRDLKQALWASAITLFDSVLYVQARIATLDVFLMAFCALALAFFTLSLKERKSPRKSFVLAMLMGVSLGLASACKLSGLFLLVGILAVRLLIGLFSFWRVRFEDPRETDFFAPDAWAALTPSKAFLALVVAPFLAYFLAYLPQMIHEGSILEFFSSQRRMIEIMTGKSATHPYSSLWFDWPAMTRPVWYLFHVEGAGVSAWSAENPAQAIVALANPLVFYAGEAAILVMAWRWIAGREIDGMIVAVGFLSQYLPWALNPKGLEFFYYYFPALLCLGPALALTFFRARARLRNGAALGFLVLAGLTFVFYLPVLSAQFPVGPNGFSQRIWFDSWR